MTKPAKRALAAFFVIAIFALFLIIESTRSASADEAVNEPYTNPVYTFHDAVCGQLSVLLTNDPVDESTYPEPISFTFNSEDEAGVATELASGTLPEQDSDASSFQDVFTFPEDSGVHTVTLFVDGEMLPPAVTVESDCEPEVTPPPDPDPDPDDNVHHGCFDPYTGEPVTDEQEWIDTHGPNEHLICAHTQPGHDNNNGPKPTTLPNTGALDHSGKIVFGVVFLTAGLMLLRRSRKIPT